jgi:hypothetical protein
MNQQFKCTVMNMMILSAITGIVTGCDPEDDNLPTFVITPQAGPHGQIYPNVPKTVEKGTVHTFIVTPEKGYTATAIGCGGVLDQDVYTTQPITTDCVINASFSLDNSLSFTVTPTAGTHGSITPASVLKKVSNGTVLTFIITPDDGYIATVTGCGGTLAGNIYTTRPITADCTVSATFTLTKENPIVTPKAGLHGSITPSTPQTVKNGEVITFKVTSDDGYTATVDGCGGVLTRDSYKTSPIIADCTVTASFEASTDDTGDINKANAKKVLDTALVTLIVVQTNTSKIYVDHIVNGPSNIEIPGLTRKVDEEIPCDDIDPRFPVLSTGLARLSEGVLSRNQPNAEFTFNQIKLIDFNGSPVCNLGSGNPGTMSNFLDGGPAPGPDVSIAISSKGDDGLTIKSGYAYEFNKLPMIINLGSPQPTTVSGFTTTAPSVFELMISWTNTFGELDTIKVIDQDEFAPPYSETRHGPLGFQMSSMVLEKVLNVGMPQLKVTQEPTKTTGAYLLTDYQGKEIMKVSSVVDNSGIALFCRELYKADTTTGFYCKSFEYKVNGGEAQTYVLP